MIDVLVNPPEIESTYLRYLNTCFEHWGDQEMYRWCFERQVGNLKADLMLLKSDKTTIAGSAVTYRPVILANRLVNVGIMTGSWTLPEARGHGCFTRIIQESVRLASNKGAAFLLAFVTESNASFRRLAAAGSALYPTHYIFSNEQTPKPASTVSVSPVTDLNHAVAIILERLNKRSSGTAHFSYTREEWGSQFLERPTRVECVEIGVQSFAVMERAEVFDRVLLLSIADKMNFAECAQALLKRALDHQRRLFLFTTDSAWRETCLSLRMGHAPGYLTTLPANNSPDLPGLGDLKGLDWDIQSGDRM